MVPGFRPEVSMVAFTASTVKSMATTPSFNSPPCHTWAPTVTLPYSNSNSTISRTTAVTGSGPRHTPWVHLALPMSLWMNGAKITSSQPPATARLPPFTTRHTTTTITDHLKEWMSTEFMLRTALKPLRPPTAIHPLQVGEEEVLGVGVLGLSSYDLLMNG